MMKIPIQIANIYNDLSSIAKELEMYVDEKLKETCDSKQWLFIHRIKQVESFALKLETGRYKSIKEIDDFFACTIVVPNTEGIIEAEQFVKQHFKVRERKPNSNKDTVLLPENFSYDSLRLYCLVSNIGIEKNYSNLIFEIQIKTFLEHAWAIATHDFQYKTDEVSWSKTRIVSQLKAILDNVELSIHEAKYLSKSENIKKEHKDYKKLNKIIKFYKENWTAEKLPTDIRRLALTTKALMENLGINIDKLKEILQNENNIGKGCNILSLSPYQIILQSIINQKPDLIKTYLDNINDNDNFHLLFTPSIIYPSDYDLSKILLINGNEVQKEQQLTLEGLKND